MARLLWAAVVAAALPAAARAELFLTMTQQGSNVVVGGSGSLNLSGLSLGGNDIVVSGVSPSVGSFATGVGMPVFGYTGYTGLSSFGPGGVTFSSSDSGTQVGIHSSVNFLILPVSYVSNGSLTTSSTFANTTIAGLGVTPGTYRWFWNTTSTSLAPAGGGFGPTPPSPTDGITLTVQAVPEPGTVGLGLSATATALAGWRTRRRWAV